MIREMVMEFINKKIKSIFCRVSGDMIHLSVVNGCWLMDSYMKVILKEINHVEKVNGN